MKNAVMSYFIIGYNGDGFIAQIKDLLYEKYKLFVHNSCGLHTKSTGTLCLYFIHLGLDCGRIHIKLLKFINRLNSEMK